MIQDQELNNVEELLGAYALHALDDHERRIVEQHLSECGPCRTELDEHRQVATMLSGGAIPPPDRVWNQILGKINAETPEQNLASVISLEQARKPIGLRSLGWVAGMAAAVVVALSAGLITQSGRIGDLNSRLADQEQQIETLASALQTDPLQQAVTAALADPGAQVANLVSDETAGAMLIVVLPDGTGYVFQNTLEPLPEDSTYQLWAVVDDKVISAGVLGNRPDIVPFHIDPEGLQGLVITQEVAGGVPQSEADPFVAWCKA